MTLFEKTTPMTIKEAALKSLEDLNRLASYSEVYQHIVDNNYYDFGAALTPAQTISAALGDFIRKGDTRVKRMKQSNGGFMYYLSILAHVLDTETVESNDSPIREAKTSNKKGKTFEERDLHILLASYLKSTDVYAKTIFHEQSKNGRDNNQIWTHPDVVGIRFLKLQSKASQNFLKSINRVDALKLSSYEIKREINSDAELKKAFFQAVSNSSWANYGYLVAFEFSDSLADEMERLSQSFGIGIIELNPNAYQSKVLQPAKFRDLDFKTIDKLCKINSEFAEFIEKVDKLLTADDKYVHSTRKELDEFCDRCFANDSAMERYCEEKGIMKVEVE